DLRSVAKVRGACLGTLPHPRAARRHARAATLSRYPVRTACVGSAPSKRRTPPHRPTSLRCTPMSRLFFMLSRWPLALLHPLGSGLGWLTYLISPSYRRRLAAHSRQAGLNRSQRWQAVAHTGKMVAESPRLWGRPRELPLGDSVRWVHPEVVQQALGEGR